MTKTGSFNKIKFKIQPFGSSYLITANFKAQNVCITTNKEILYKNIDSSASIVLQRLARKEIYRLIKNNVDNGK